MARLLVIPNEEYIESYAQACREMKENKEKIISNHNPNNFEELKYTIFEQFDNDRSGVNLPNCKVPESTFWLVEDGEYIGSGMIRHFLNNNYKIFGGHISYVIRPSKRRIGYGSELLKLLLHEAAKLGIYEAILTCNETNIAAVKVIEKNGGIKIDVFDYEHDGETATRYRYKIPNMPNLYLNSAAYYDFDNSSILKNDIPFYIEYACKLKNPKILELACGTGRVSIPLAREGATVYGIDLSQPMLDEFFRKIKSEEKEIQERITLVKADMTNFDLPEKQFPLIIIPVRGFQALTSESDAESCLKQVYSHLSNDGLFIINVFRPHELLEESWILPETLQYEHTIENTGVNIKKYTSDNIDSEIQIIYSVSKYEITQPNGDKEFKYEHLAIKYYYYEQIKKIVIKCGFSIMEEFGDYDKSSVDGNKEIILVCKKALDN